MSWNGATEVTQWKLFKSDDRSERALEVTVVPRSGFETAIAYNGYASYVFVEALDKTGKTLGKSRVIETIQPEDMSTAAVAEEMAWLQEGHGESHDQSWKGEAKEVLSNPMVTFVSGIVCGVVIFLAVLVVRRRGLPWHRTRSRKGPLYEPVAEGDAYEFDEAKLDNASPLGRHRRGLSSDVYRLPEDDEYDDDDDSGSTVSGRTPFVRQTSGA